MNKKIWMDKCAVHFQYMSIKRSTFSANWMKPLWGLTCFLVRRPTRHFLDRSLIYGSNGICFAALLQFSLIIIAIIRSSNMVPFHSPIFISCLDNDASFNAKRVLTVLYHFESTKYPLNVLFTNKTPSLPFESFQAFFTSKYMRDLCK